MNNKTTIIGLGILAYFLYAYKASASEITESTTGVTPSGIKGITGITSGLPPINIPINPVMEDIQVALPNYDIPIHVGPGPVESQVVITQPTVDAVSVVPATQTATQTVETTKIDPVFTIPTLKPPEVQPIVEITKSPIQTMPPPSSSIMPTAPGALPGPESVTLTVSRGSYAGPFIVFKDGLMHTYTVNGVQFIYTGTAYHMLGFVNDQNGVIHEVYLNSIYGSYNNENLYDYAEKASILLLSRMSEFFTGAFNSMSTYTTVKKVQVY